MLLPYPTAEPRRVGRVTHELAGAFDGFLGGEDRVGADTRPADLFLVALSCVQRHARVAESLEHDANVVLGLTLALCLVAD